jgi:hypothetical protein
MVKYHRLVVVWKWSLPSSNWHFDTITALICPSLQKFWTWLDSNLLLLHKVWCLHKAWNLDLPISNQAELLSPKQLTNSKALCKSNSHKGCGCTHYHATLKLLFCRFLCNLIDIWDCSVRQSLPQHACYWPGKQHQISNQTKISTQLKHCKHASMGFARKGNSIQEIHLIWKSSNKGSAKKKMGMSRPVPQPWKYLRLPAIQSWSESMHSPYNALLNGSWHLTEACEIYQIFQAQRVSFELRTTGYKMDSVAAATIPSSCEC